MTSADCCQFVPPYLLAHLAAGAGDSPGRLTQRLDAELRERRTGAPTDALPSPAGATAQDDGTKVVCTASNTETLPGTRVRGEGEPASGDAAVDEAYASTGQVYDLFATVFDRQSVDDKGGLVTVTVHYGTNYDNAFWDGKQLVLGDGDGTVFGRFTSPPDVLYHEFTHGVTQFTAGLTYQGQSGALNESMSDCFAMMCTQRVAGQSADEATWLIGAGLFLPGINATALRSMKAPGTAYDDPAIGKDPQVGSMADYLHTTDDNGGVHTNSGIPNRAFYLASTNLGGNSWERPGAIWYATLTGSTVTASTDFAGFATATVEAAQRLYGTSAADAVRSAWRTVGVLAADGDTARTTSPAPVPAGRVLVRRSGGFTGATREGEVELDDSPEGAELAALLERARSQAAAPEPPVHADSFTYTVSTHRFEVTIAEGSLTPEQREIVRRVLGD